MDNLEATLRVNKFARKKRHLKNFSKSGASVSTVGILYKNVRNPLDLIKRTDIFRKGSTFLNSAQSFLRDILPVSPKRRLLFNVGIVAISGVMMSSLSTGSTFIAASMDYSTDYISSYSLPGDILVSDESGYLVKVNPQTDDSNRIGLTDYAVHTVADGESLSGIAIKYDINVETIMWENGLANANSIRAGQALLVPPVDGIGYNVKSGDNLEKIAAKYEIPTESIVAQNTLETEILQKGQALFLPGAEPIQPIIVSAPSTYRNSTITRDDRTYVSATASTATPAGGMMFIFPTRGAITQGYHGGHYALDIADRSKPPIWAAGGGTVTKSSTGTWGGGYGNHVIIDHGNGYTTLYAHMDSVNVYVGQYVNQGDVLGIMGNTGRVYGATGIHLHWEVALNGVKQSPYNFY
jgi:murein DD-endopeptidase MepM/ murein hydrolase activator NlpD